MRRRPPRPGALSCCLAAAALVLCVDAAVEFLGTSDGHAKSHGASPDLWPWPWHAACAVGCALERDVQEHSKRRGERAEEEGANGAAVAPDFPNTDPRVSSQLSAAHCAPSADFELATERAAVPLRRSLQGVPGVQPAGGLTQTGGSATCTCRRACSASRVRSACSLALSHMPKGRQHPTPPPAHH